MSVFARREIQKRLHDISTIVGMKKLRSLIDALNVAGSESNENRFVESLSNAWEVVIVAAFAECGKVQYERKISNKKRPDIIFRDEEIELIADVFAVSDDAQHKKNPVNEFSTILRKLWMELGPRIGGLEWDVKGIDILPKAHHSSPNLLNTHEDGFIPYLSSRLRPINQGKIKRLTLPPRDELSKYLYDKVGPFFEEIRKCSEYERVLNVDEKYNSEISVCFSIKYTPSGTGMVGSYPDYTAITDIESHVLWRRLNHDKIAQFAGATESMPRVLFLCDAGIASISRSSSKGPTEYLIEEVLNYLWKRPVYLEGQEWTWVYEKDISAVIVVSIEVHSEKVLSMGKSRFMLSPRLYENPYASYPLNEVTKKLLWRVVSNLPVPIETPKNVLHTVSINPNLTHYMGCLTVSNKRIEMSGIELLRILSGDVSLEDFCRKYRLDSNPFNDALKRFQTIKSLKIEKLSDSDDDKIIIEFGAQDPAIGPFIMPKKNNNEV